MEDEIASLGAVIGASLAGAKAMTATSGPGFSLMQENLGFACMAEVPCVIVNVMRGGPSTGLPTHVSQGDVMQARWGTHGDHPIIVLAAATARECFDLTVTAFNLSEKYRTPVILLTDEVVAHTREKVALPETAAWKWWTACAPRRRRNGMSPTPIPPAGCRPWASSATATATTSPGWSTTSTAFPPNAPTRSCRSWTGSSARSPGTSRSCMVESESTEDAEILVVAYGSVARSARRAIREAGARGLKAGLMQLVTLWPFPRRLLTPLLRQVRAVLVPELNMGQMSREVKRVNRG